MNTPPSALDLAIGPDPRSTTPLTQEEFEAAMKKVKPLDPYRSPSRGRAIDDDDRDWEYFAGIGSFRWK